MTIEYTKKYSTRVFRVDNCTLRFVQTMLEILSASPFTESVVIWM